MCLRHQYDEKQVKMFPLKYIAYFWKCLGNHHPESYILRFPLQFPPHKTGQYVICIKANTSKVEPFDTVAPVAERFRDILP